MLGSEVVEEETVVEADLATVATEGWEVVEAVASSQGCASAPRQRHLNYF